MREMGISEFKAKCIEELKTVQRTGEPILVTLRRQPIATVAAYREPHPKRELGRLRGRITLNGDIVQSDFGGEWEMDQ